MPDSLTGQKYIQLPVPALSRKFQTRLGEDNLPGGFLIFLYQLSAQLRSIFRPLTGDQTGLG
jgi:hypothetical protein